jgi:hypothetical protein
MNNCFLCGNRYLFIIEKKLIFVILPPEILLNRHTFTTKYISCGKRTPEADVFELSSYRHGSLKKPTSKRSKLSPLSLSEEDSAVFGQGLPEIHTLSLSTLILFGTA